MHINELQKIARERGVTHIENLTSEKLLIHAIQETCGQPPCFLSDNRFTCDVKDCEWRADCKRLTAIWMR